MSQSFLVDIHTDRLQDLILTYEVRTLGYETSQIGWIDARVISKYEDGLATRCICFNAFWLHLVVKKDEVFLRFDRLLLSHIHYLAYKSDASTQCESNSLSFK